MSVTLAELEPFLAAVRAGETPCMAADYLLERGAELPDVLRLFAGTPEGGHLDGLPGGVLREYLRCVGHRQAEWVGEPRLEIELNFHAAGRINTVWLDPRSGFHTVWLLSSPKRTPLWEARVAVEAGQRYHHPDLRGDRFILCTRTDPGGVLRYSVSHDESPVLCHTGHLEGERAWRRRVLGLFPEVTFTGTCPACNGYDERCRGCDGVGEASYAPCGLIADETLLRQWAQLDQMEGRSVVEAAAEYREEDFTLRLPPHLVSSEDAEYVSRPFGSFPPP